MASKKHYIITSITLGLIASASAGLIGLVNFFTYKQIEKNEIAKINKGIEYLFGSGAEVKEENDLKDYKYVTHYYALEGDRFAFRTTGSNMYGKVSLLVGYENNEFVKFYVITDEQTYSTTLEDNYINLVNSGERDVDDVVCGATYGATLIRDMIKEAGDAEKALS